LNQEQLSESVQSVEDEIRSIGIKYAPAIMRSLVNVAINPKSPPTTVIMASNIIFDRCFGKPKASLNVTANTGSFVEILRGLGDIKSKEKEEEVKEELKVEVKNDQLTLLGPS
jgi:hypothetical protein